MPPLIVLCIFIFLLIPYLCDVLNPCFMLPTQGTLSFSNHFALYDLIITKDNLLRQIKELIDFSFVREELINIAWIMVVLS